jgi:hypothetical protein
MAAVDKSPAPADLAERLFSAAFNVPRSPRSAEYKAGARAVLEYRINGTRISCPHPSASAQSDAFHAGCTEGHQIWRAYTEEKEYWQANANA